MEVRKKVWSSVVTVLSPIALFSGLALDIPQLIQRESQRLPEWFSVPDACWVAFVLIVAAVALHVIWRGHQSVKPENPKHAQALGIHAEFSRNYRYVKNHYLTNADLQFCAAYLEVIVPAQIEFMSGAEDREKYVELLYASKVRTNLLALQFAATMPLLDKIVAEAGRPTELAA